ncbi:MAG: DUF1501 domain-containing protein [Candidatus Sumerlaeaceae bacterium]|nr:DUF1501 domain-containing protein [Candidatus Sumerlaeaceae bacterium]
MTMRRRTFLQGCCSGIIAMSGSHLGNLVFGQGGSTNRDILVTVFLRGGMDALSLLSPFNDPNYLAGRTRLALPGNQVLAIDGYFGLHPSATALKTMYDNKHLALIPACGFPEANRSHFDAQDSMERGKVGDSARLGDGWIARHLNNFRTNAVFQGVTFSSTVDTSLEGFSGGLALSDAGDFTLYTGWNQGDDIRRALRTMYAYDGDLGDVVKRTLDASDLIDANPPDAYVPQNGVVYPDTGFSDTMKSLAQLIRMNVGLEAATVDLGGWDTHESQAYYGSPTQGYFSGMIQQLSGGLGAFWNDLADFHGKLTVVVMSEFGRRLKENDNIGTDHGHGGLMMVISSNVSQKKVWGTWPGLDNDQLTEHVDLRVTTDFRTILAEILAARRGQTDVATLFPGFTYDSPLGIFGASPVSVRSSIEDWARY